MSSPASTDASSGARDSFSSQKVFILAAIGSAVGLGNIWRFPYVAYEGGGGAFMIPYVIALLCAGIPMLLLDYAVGHKYRGGPPLALARLNLRAEWLGWWQALVCVIIATYYAVILAWAAMYTWYSIDHRWGDDPAGFFMKSFVQVEAPERLSTQIVPQVMIPLIVVWIVCIIIMCLGVDKGIGMLSVIFIPILAVTFVTMCLIALTLPGAAEGLNAFFTPDWGALTQGSVWMSAIGQIFFSLSVGFGIMITYSSYVDRKTDITGSGLVVGFANSSFELLAGIGVFAALGFMATQAGVGVSDVADSGIGLAFIAFPTIISQAPLGSLIGVLFFVSLFIAGITSMVSILEVGISSLREKLGLSRVGGSLAMCLPVAVASCALLGTRTGLPVLDVLDSFVNTFGILAGATVMMLAIAFAFRQLPALRDHLNSHGTFKVGRVWIALVAVVIPAALLYLLGADVLAQLAKPYGGYPQWFINVFGWTMAAALPVIAFVLSKMRWSKKAHITAKHTYTPQDTGTGVSETGLFPLRGNRGKKEA